MTDDDEKCADCGHPMRRHRFLTGYGGVADYLCDVDECDCLRSFPMASGDDEEEDR